MAAGSSSQAGPIKNNIVPERNDDETLPSGSNKNQKRKRTYDAFPNNLVSYFVYFIFI